MLGSLNLGEKLMFELMAFETWVVVLLIVITLLITWGLVGMREIAINLQNTVNNIFTTATLVGEIKESIEEAKGEG
tara:strand:- start:551 stop:778 length:228 start_codon:yes stop_codon:yes gene_type:complete